MTAALLVLAVLVVGWFAAGSIVNVRRGHAAMRWMQAGLPTLGERTTVRWLGTTLVELTIAKAEPPFERVALVVFLEPRDVPWLWALGRQRGRRDTLIVRAGLQHAPADDLELLDRRSWSGRDALRRVGSERWSVREPRSAEELAAFYKFEPTLSLGDSLFTIAREAGMKVRRLATHRGQPNFELHVDLPGLSSSSGEFFAALRTMAERASHR
ncbi:MAG: hypothetical protein ACHQQS_16755 [Thermoanaerobaculales bacterium]